MKRTVFSLLALLLVVSANSFSQQPSELVSNRAGRTIIIDGDASDPAWGATIPIDIDVAYSTEQPTLNSATWKVLWDSVGFYILIEVSDDVWTPSWISGLNSWESDKVELYIDVTDPQKDGNGASGGNGNYQVAPDFPNGNEGNQTDFDGLGTVYAGTFDGTGTYTMEYYVPFVAIPTNNGDIIDPYVNTTIGFDPTIIDLDEVSAGRNRAVWANAGAIDESWNNMDDVGLITFVNASDDLMALFSSDKRTTGPGKEIQFTDYSNGTPTSWLWNFGDGITSTEQNPLHAYTSIGDYDVSLTVTDADDSTSSITQTNYISITAGASEPTSIFSVSAQMASTDQRISFTDESIFSPTSWTWYFGDGGISTEQNPSHYYTSPGTYTVALVTSNNNGSHTLRKIDYITVTQGLAPVADFSANKTSVMMDEQMQFTDQSTNNPTRWEWDFGDGNESTLQNPVYTYTRAGTYDVSLEVGNSSGEGFMEKLEFVVIVAAPLSALSPDNNSLLIYPNPSKGMFKINTKDLLLKNGQLNVYDFNGKNIYSAEQLEGDELYLDLRNQSKGIYYLQLHSNNSFITQKLIIE